MTSDGNWWRANEIVVIRHHSRESETRQSFRVNSPADIRPKAEAATASSALIIRRDRRGLAIQGARMGQLAASSIE
jgi:hypothetical protein